MSITRDLGLNPVDARHNDRVIEWMADYRAWIAESIQPTTEATEAWYAGQRARQLILLGQAAALFAAELGERA